MTFLSILCQFQNDPKGNETYFSGVKCAGLCLGILMVFFFDNALTVY